MKHDANLESEEGLDEIKEKKKQLEEDDKLSKRIHILVTLCLEEMKRDWNKEFNAIDRTISTPVKSEQEQQPYQPRKTPNDPRRGRGEQKYAPVPSKPRASKGAVQIYFNRRDERRGTFERYHDKNYPTQTPTQMKTPHPQTMESSTGEISEKTNEKYVKGMMTNEEINGEIKKADAYGECNKKTIMKYETCNNEQMNKINELMMELCKEDNKTTNDETMTTLKDETEGFEGGANDVIVSLFTALFVNGKYEWEQ